MTDIELKEAALAAEVVRANESAQQWAVLQRESAEAAYKQLAEVFPTLRLLPNGRLWLYGREWDARSCAIRMEDASLVYALADEGGWMVSDMASLGRWINEQETRSNRPTHKKGFWERLFS